MRFKHKFSQQSKLMDFTSKIADVINSVGCNRHKALQGAPCFNVPRDTGGFYRGVCNRRVMNVYNGTITASAVMRRPESRNSK